MCGAVKPSSMSSIASGSHCVGIKISFEPDANVRSIRSIETCSHIFFSLQNKQTQVRIEAFQRFVLEQIQKECIVPIAPEIMARYGGDIHRGAKDASDAGTWCWCSSFRHWCSSVLLAQLRHNHDDTHLYHKKSLEQF